MEAAVDGIEVRAFSAGVDLKALAGQPVVNGAVGDVLDLSVRGVTHLLSTMPWGMSQRLIRLVGAARARDLS